MLTINTTCEKFSQETLGFVKKTLSCSASVFTWFDDLEHTPTYFHDGYNDDFIRQYYDEYLEHDPLNHHNLIGNNTLIARLSNNFHDVDYYDDYQNFMKKCGYVDEADLVLWAASKPIASIALLKMDQDPPFTDNAMLKQVRNFIQFNFSLLPPVKRLNLQPLLKETYLLTTRESVIAYLLYEGISNKEIAIALDIEAATVKSHLKSIFEKLQVNTRAQAVSIMSDL